MTGTHPQAELGTRIRLHVLEQSHRAGIGHIGSSLSVADLLAAIYSDEFTLDGPDRDRFILAKGHAALALYAVLYERGIISRAELDSYCTDGTALGGHPDPTVAGIDFATGSLGQGLSFAVGAALAARLDDSSRRSFVLMSDAELNEGAVWEAIMFAGHHHLHELLAIVDLNKQQALGYTADVLDLEPLAEKWDAFGWVVHDVDGHDIEALRSAIVESRQTGSAPSVILARTTFGSGVSFMEGVIDWHYLPLSDGQYAEASAEVSAR
jgi:transketolase